jgi:hypothetical protein
MKARKNGHGHTESAKKVSDWASRHTEMVSKVQAGEIVGLASGSGRKRLQLLIQQGKLVIWVWGAGRRQQLAMMTSCPRQLAERLEQEFGQRRRWDVTFAQHPK